MCDPLTLLTGASALFGLFNTISAPGPADPPPVPAGAAAQARTPGATVRLGIGKEDNTTSGTAGTAADPFQEKRTTANSLGNLGRSGLSI